MRAVLFLALAASVLACDVGPAEPCGGGCDFEPAACDGCPALANELCVDGACVEVGDKDVAVTADVNVDRALGQSVTALTVAVLDARVASCDDVADLAAADGVVSGTRVDVSGGTFHPDLSFGSAPEGDAIVAVNGLDDAGAVVGSGCVEVALSGAAQDVGVVNVAP